MRARHPRSPFWRYGIAAGSVAVLTAILLLLPRSLRDANLVVFYVPLVTLVALVAGRRASILASLLAFLGYNFFFVPPLYTLAVERLEHIVELWALLTVALVVGTLVAQSRSRAQESSERVERLAALYEVC